MRGEGAGSEAPRERWARRDPGEWRYFLGAATVMVVTSIIVLVLNHAGFLLMCFAVLAPAFTFVSGYCLRQHMLNAGSVPRWFPIPLQGDPPSDAT